MKKGRCLRISVLFLVLSAASAFSEVSLSVLSEETGASVYVDYWNGIYELKRGSRSIRLSPGKPYMIIDYNETRVIPEIKTGADGAVLLDDSSAGVIRMHFSSIPESGPVIGCIVLDPGHGGKDPGAVGVYQADSGQQKIREKDVVLETALMAAAMLKDRYPDRKIILTRNDDRYLTLEERTEIANAVELEENESMVFISIHANASFNTKASGFEVWYLPPEFRRDVINKDRMAGVDSDILPILNTMLEEEYTVESILLGEKILAALDSEVGDLSQNRGPKEESWFVVRNVKMPSVLIELGFVTNQQEASLLADKAYLKKMAKAIYNGVDEFINDFENDRRSSE